MEVFATQEEADAHRRSLQQAPGQRASQQTRRWQRNSPSSSGSGNPEHFHYSPVGESTITREGSRFFRYPNAGSPPGDEESIARPMGTATGSTRHQRPGGALLSDHGSWVHTATDRVYWEHGSDDIAKAYLAKDYTTGEEIVYPDGPLTCGEIIVPNRDYCKRFQVGGCNGRTRDRHGFMVDCRWRHGCVYCGCRRGAPAPTAHGSAATASSTAR